MNHGYEAESSGANLNCEQTVDMQTTRTTSVVCSTSNPLQKVKSTNSLYLFYCLLYFLIHWFIFHHI